MWEATRKANREPFCGRHAAVPHLCSMFTWVGFACLVASSEADCGLCTSAGCTGTCAPASAAGCGNSQVDNCLVIDDTYTGSLGMMTFSGSSLTSLYIEYDTASLGIGKMGLKAGPSIVYMECSDPSSADCNSDCMEPSCDTCPPSCPCTTRPWGSIHSMGFKNEAVDFRTCCGSGCETGLTAEPPPPSPPPPPPPSPPPPSPSPPAAECGIGTKPDPNPPYACIIDCDESGRRLFETPSTTPADADASEIARESREAEQSARARKAIDIYMASLPNLDDAQRSVLAYHWEKIAAESLWFPEQE